jgi:hypothetical protein
MPSRSRTQSPRSSSPSSIRRETRASPQSGWLSLFRRFAQTQPVGLLWANLDIPLGNLFVQLFRAAGHATGRVVEHDPACCKGQRVLIVRPLGRLLELYRGKVPQPAAEPAFAQVGCAWMVGFFLYRETSCTSWRSWSKTRTRTGGGPGR